MVSIKRNILSQRLKNVPNRKMTPKYITIHNTANSSRGANAEMPSRYQHNGSGGRQTSWHYSVDDKEIWQTLEDNQQGWHTGTSKGNAESIGIEICENSEGDFEKAVSNAQELIKSLMNKHNIPLNRVVTHKYWSGKNCPRLLLNRWSSFVKGIDVRGGSISKPASKLNKSSGGSVVDYMNSHGLNSNFSSRKILATQYGIRNYSGTASQNNQLLAKLKGGKKPKAKKSISTMAKEVIDGKHGSGHSNRRSSLNISQSEYNKVRAEVNRKAGVSKPKPKPKQAWTGQSLKPGNTGARVRQLQQMLVKKNFYPDRHAKNNGIDGSYGPATKNAVERFQLMNGLVIDGFAGPATYRKLR